MVATSRPHVLDAIKAIISIPGWVEKGGRKVTVSDTEMAIRYQSSVWVHTCVEFRSDAAASVPWLLVRGKKDAESEVPDEHPAAELLKTVGPEMNWADLIRATEADLNLFGKAYWLKQRPGNGPPRALLRLNPATVEKEADRDGIKSFSQTLNGQKEVFKREDVVYFRTYHPSDDLGGLGAAQVARNAADAAIASGEYTAAFFENYAIPPVMMTSEQTIPDAEMSRIKAWWDRWFRGAKKQHKIGIMGGGLKPTILGYPTKDLALADVLAEARREVCAAFRVPPALAGAWEAANYSASQEQRKSFWQDTMIPRLDYIAAVIESELLVDFEKGLRWKWEYQEIEALTPDLKVEAERHALLVREGIEDAESAAEALGVEPAPPKEVPPQLQPFQQPQPNGNGDLAKWERKALKRLKSGQKAACEFESENISPAEAARIFGELQSATTTEDVKAVFGNGHSPPSEDMSALASAVRAAAAQIAFLQAVAL